MKSIVLAAALAVALPAQPLLAGPTAPKMKAEAIHLSTSDRANSAGGIIVPLILLAVIVLALTSGGEGESMMYAR